MLLEILGGLVAFFALLFGIEKYKGVKEREEYKEREAVHNKELLRRQSAATEALVRGVVNEEQAVADPDKHDFNK